ncbi:MAG: murein L,D-transpeptidase family protein [Bacteroidia bacterium]
MKLITNIIIFICCGLLLFAGIRLVRNGPDIDVGEKAAEELTLKQLLDTAQVDSSHLFIWIKKEACKLMVVSADSQIIKTYPVVFGGNPKDDKLRQGDKCTPEGTFHIRSAYPHDNWRYFAWIDYPTEDSWRKHRKAKAEGRIPQSASIGGEIGIHGVPEGDDYAIEYKIHWTLGCISLTNKDITELFPYIQQGRKVVIEK